MASKAALAVVLLLAASLAGCSGDGDGGGDSSSTSSSGSRITYTATRSTTSAASTSGSATTTSTGPAPNQAPAGSIAASVNGTHATFNLTGSDPDGDALVWDLEFGDGNATNGTTLPASVTHTYNATGNLTATLTLTDGTARTSYNVTVAVAASGGGAQAFTGSWVGGGAIACEQIINGDNLHQDAGPGEGVLFVTFAIDPSSVGKDFTVAIAAEAPAGLYELDFYGQPGGQGGTLAYFPSTDPTAVTMTGFGGTVPEGSVSAVFFPCTAGPGEFTFAVA